MYYNKYNPIISIATEYNLHLHLQDAFIQSDRFRLYICLFFLYVSSLGIEPTTFCAANEMLYHWATGTPNFD